MHAVIAIATQISGQYGGPHAKACKMTPKKDIQSIAFYPPH